MIDRLFDVYADILELLLPEITNIADIDGGDISKLVACSEQRLFPIEHTDLTGLCGIFKLDNSCVIYNGCNGMSCDSSAGDLLKRLTSIGFKQIILTGFAVPDEIHSQPIDISSSKVNLFYEHTLNDNDILNMYAKSVQSAESELQ